MISIIICSRKADISQELKDNIATTIGCEYELCVIDNSRNEYSIFSAYNEGVRRAKGDVLCFMHEDVLFRCEKWGKKLEEDFAKDEKVGCVGLIGVQYLPKKPIGMWYVAPSIGGVIQGRRDERGKYYVSKDLDKEHTELTEVVGLDGFLMAIKKALFDVIKWDEESYKGFHLYDMDICMQVLQAGYKVCVDPQIAVEHKSLGNASKDWDVAMQRFFRKWENSLPIVRGIELSVSEVSWRDRLYDVVLANDKLRDDIARLHQSYAYRVGKALIKLFKWLKR